MEITGTTQLVPIIGRPVETVFSPPAFNRWFSARDLDVRMVALDVAPEALGPFLSVLRSSHSLLGCSVTYPHKQAAFDICDHRTDRARRLGALNTIRRLPDGRLSGDATDGLAMITAIRATGQSLAGKSALVLGAGGGAGQAIADALCAAGIATLSLVDIDAARQTQVTRTLRSHWPETRLTNTPGPHDILVNATVLGKSDQDPLPFAPALIETAEIICDVVTGDGVTPLVDRARRLGKRVVTGSDMGRGQLEPQLRFLGLWD